MPSAETVAEWMLPVEVMGEIVICAKEGFFMVMPKRSCSSDAQRLRAMATNTTAKSRSRTPSAILRAGRSRGGSAEGVADASGTAYRRVAPSPSQRWRFAEPARPLARPKLIDDRWARRVGVALQAFQIPA